MSTLNTRLRILALGVSTILTVAAGSSSQAAPLTLSDSPVFLTQGVQPNLIMAIDDSGSMDFEVLLRGNDGSAWWRSATADDDCTAATGRTFVGCVSDGKKNVPDAGKLNFNNDGGQSTTWFKYSYLFPNGSNSADDSYQRRLDDGSAHYAIPPLPEYAWSRSPDHNKAYFNPATTYARWPDGGGYTFADASPSAARFDPVFGLTSNTLNLTRDVAGTGQTDSTTACDSTGTSVGSNFYFRVQEGMTIPAGTCIRQEKNGTEGTDSKWELVRTGDCLIQTYPATGACKTLDGNNNHDHTLYGGTGVAIRYFPATFYLANTASLPAGYGYTATPSSTGKAPDGTTLYGYEIKLGNFVDQAAYDKAIQNFANWFSYSRKRHQALRAGLGNAFLTISGMRVAGFTINSNTANVTMDTIDNATHRKGLYTQFYKDFVQSGGTPNRKAVYNIVRNFQRAPSGTDPSPPIQYACQKNFGMLFTDGFSETGGGFDSVGNVDGNKGAPYADTTSNTLADGVMQAYVTKIRGDLASGKVMVAPACTDKSKTPPASLDCNVDPHMNFYAVTLGTRGIEFNPDASPAQDPYTTQPTWPTAFFTRHPSAVDDIWHATVNGRGKLLNAKSSDDLSKKLSEVLQAVQADSPSASSASVSSGSIRSNTQVFQAKFDTDSWTGHLISYKIAADGSITPSDGSNPPAPPAPTPANWGTGGEADVPLVGARKIFTVLSNGTKVDFDWANVKGDTTRVTELGATAAEAEDVLNYIRGDRTKESAATNPYRKRDSLLGDIVNSSPIFVGAPRQLYGIDFPDAGYSTFKQAKSKRVGMVYVGANDGMLHAFNANDGSEQFAYVPGAVTRNLKQLTSPTYGQGHKYFVDGSPNSGDVFYNSAWHTVVLGGLNRGGQAIYALEVTDVTAPTSANVLWEFTHADLGYTYSQPQIVRLENGKWGAVFGNGYNSSEVDPDGTRGSGVAMLFIVDIETGALIKTITTGVGDQTTPNGLATPTVVDNDGDNIADYVYAGDLRGNVWKFDLTDKSDANWKVSYADASNNPLPLYTAMDSTGTKAQPITSRLDVARGPGGVGMLVLFGTGKFVEATDRADKSTQTFYGIYDPNAAGTDAFSGRSDLKSQKVEAEIAKTKVSIKDAQGNTVLVDTLEARVTSSNAPGTRGWYIDLLPSSGTAAGERVVSNATFRDGRIIFSTLIPSTDVCDWGGDSWIMELDALTGKRLTESPIDVNRDGKIDAADYVKDANGNLVPASGFKSDVGIVNGVGIAADPVNPVEYKYMAGSKGTMQTIRESSNPKARGRQSWRSVR